VQVDTLCVIGAGTMGTGIAQVAAQAGIRVHLVDVSEQALSASPKRLARSLEDSVERRKLTRGQAEDVRRLVSWDISLDRLGKADFAIEAVFEDLGVKEQVLREVSSRLREGVPLATNTSTFRINNLAQLCGRPECFLGLHFFNPVPAMKLVEVIPGERTLAAVTESATDLCERMRKTPITAPDVPGFLVNRAFAALVAAAVDLWASGGAPEAIDSATELGLGHKMGPLKTADLVGLDVMLAILRSLHEQTGHPRFEPAPKLVELVESGQLGRKTGRGFYVYE